MSWKEFFRPTIFKIVIAIIIFMLLPNIFVSHGLDAGWGPNYDIIFIFGGFFQLIGLFRLYFPNGDLLIHNAIFIIVGIIVSYVVTCLIINKFKK